MSTDWSRRGFLQGLGLAGSGLVLADGAGATPPPAEPVDPKAGLLRVGVDTHIDGEHRVIEVDPDESALDLLRQRLGVTSCKRACGQGACGACVIQVEGVPLASCLLPASELAGRTVRTARTLHTSWPPPPEKVKKDDPPPAPAADGLHPVQRALVTADGLQCGYCTPGFAVEAAAFHDRWRVERPGEDPGEATVAAALAGHLCRCGAYRAILTAVRAACRGEHDAPLTEWTRREAPAKVTGTADYTVDLRLAGQLEGRVYRSPHAHARLIELDLEAARQSPGVRAVHRLIGNGASVLYYGQEVAAVAAETPEQAEAALRAVRAQWEPLPVVLEFAGKNPDSPLVYPERADAKAAPSASEGPVFKAPWEGNVRGPVSSSQFAKPGAGRRGVEQARGSGTVGEGRFFTQAQLHTALEPHAAVARWTGDAGLEVWCSTQSVDALADDLAERFGLRRDAVRVRAEHVGGGFGAKAGLSIETMIAVELARLAKAPVRVRLDRHEELAVGGYRPAQEIKLAVGCDPGGALLGIEHEAWADAGCSVGSNTGGLIRLMYDTPAKYTADYDVVSHGPPGRPFRAPGGPSAFFALEQALDEIAWRRNESPIALRRRWDPNPARQRLYRWAEELPVLRDRAPLDAERGRFRRGVGLACGGWFTFVSPATEVSLEVGGPGLVLRCAVQDIGTGTRTALAMRVAELFGLPLSAVQAEIGDSSFPPGPLSGGSRVTASVIPAAEQAATDLQELLVDRMRRDHGLATAEVGTGGVKHAGGTLPWAEVFQKVGRASVVGDRPRDPGGYVIPFAFGGVKIPRSFPGAVQVTQVEVDTRLGKVQVLQTWIGVGAGKLFAPLQARSQIEGGVVQGLSFTFHEERRLDPKTGRPLTVDLEAYRVAGIADIPAIEVHLDQTPFEGIAGGGVGIGELATIPTAASVANAVYHATSWRPRRLPLRPSEVLAGLGGAS